jgi:hypothetical protein
MLCLVLGCERNVPTRIVPGSAGVFVMQAKPGLKNAKLVFAGRAREESEVERFRPPEWKRAE